ncbi:hypothetical protein [Streptomyces acidicola]|uniref:hypothetical protein n=1 Tax=Streptomyces acidicola TaxID=2596892 RepID=UPI00389A438D
MTVSGRIDLIRRIDIGGQSIVDFKSKERAQADAVSRDQLHIYVAGYEELSGKRVDLVEVLNLDEGSRSSREEVNDTLLKEISGKVAKAGEATPAQRHAPQDLVVRHLRRLRLRRDLQGPAQHSVTLLDHVGPLGRGVVRYQHHGPTSTPPTRPARASGTRTRSRRIGGDHSTATAFAVTECDQRSYLLRCRNSARPAPLGAAPWGECGEYGRRWGAPERCPVNDLWHAGVTCVFLQSGSSVWPFSRRCGMTRPVPR